MLFLKILGVLGIILLILLGILIFLLLTVLFFPILYKVEAFKDEDRMEADIRINWLFGLLSGRFQYPEPGEFTVKLLWKKLFPKGTSKKPDPGSHKKAANAEKAKEAEGAEETLVPTETGETEENGETRETTKNVEYKTEEYKAEEYKTDETEGAKDTQTKQKSRAPFSLSEKLDNLQKYKELLLCEDSKELMQHLFFRLGKILKSIRPRKLKLKLTFGTGSPDTTGYAYGIYGMFLCRWGKEVYVTPDFERQRLDGTLYAKGHVIMAVLLLHGIKIAMDKHLRQLYRKLKKINHTSNNAKKAGME